MNLGHLLTKPTLGGGHLTSSQPKKSCLAGLLQSLKMLVKALALLGSSRSSLHVSGKGEEAVVLWLDEWVWEAISR